MLMPYFGLQPRAMKRGLRNGVTEDVSLSALDFVEGGGGRRAKAVVRGL